jgi:hypothetical protein
MWKLMKIVVDSIGEVIKLWTNFPERDPDGQEKEKA